MFILLFFILTHSLFHYAGKPEHGIDTTKRSAGIGEILEGNVLHNSGLKLHFGVDINKVHIIFISYLIYTLIYT